LVESGIIKTAIEIIQDENFLPNSSQSTITESSTGKNLEFAKELRDMLVPNKEKQSNKNFRF
jgi:hypothetical protein